MFLNDITLTETNKMETKTKNQAILVKSKFNTVSINSQCVISIDKIQYIGPYYQQKPGEKPELYNYQIRYIDDPIPKVITKEFYEILLDDLIKSGASNLLVGKLD